MKEIEGSSLLLFLFVFLTAGEFFGLLSEKAAQYFSIIHVMVGIGFAVCLSIEGLKDR
jgi:hypothetical protein